MLSSSPSFVCWRCAQRSLRRPKIRPGLTTKRSIGQKYLAKAAAWEKDWQAQAVEIRSKKRQSMLGLLEERGFVDSIAGDRDAFELLMTDKRVGVYAGFDPTAPSLHVGHLLPLMTLFWFYISGYHAVSLLGGATAKIGDPTGRLSTRDYHSSDVRKANMVSMHYQLKKIWMNVEPHARSHGYDWHPSWRRELVNNNEWTNKLPILDFMQLMASNVRLSTMLGRETVRNKMENGDGMSFSEFSYPLMQAWDWWYMYHTKNIQVQIGGGDQWGNIVAGVDAVKGVIKNHPDPRFRIEEEKLLTTPFGFTVPLLTTSAGEKFGKSTGNAIWLDPEMTSSFNLYQFFLRIPDADAERYLKLLTFLPLTEIASITEAHDADRSKRKAQHALAREVLCLMHGQAAAQEAEMQHRNLFRSTTTASSDEGSELDTKRLTPTPWQSAPSMNLVLPDSLVIDQSFPRVLHSAGLAESKSEGTRLCQKGGAYVGSRTDKAGGMGDSLKFAPVKAWQTEKTKEYLLDGNMMILRVGKWKVRIIRVVSDAEFTRLELDAPGWKEFLESKEEKERAPQQPSSNRTEMSSRSAQN